MCFALPSGLSFCAASKKAKGCALFPQDVRRISRCASGAKVPPVSTLQFFTWTFETCAGCLVGAVFFVSLLPRETFAALYYLIGGVLLLPEDLRA
jgi:hypothetical protein